MDSAFLKKVLNGDVQAYRYFVDKYKDMAFSIAVGIVRNSDDAEEVVQDAFLKAYNGLASFRQQSKFSTWLYKIIVNEGLKKLRRKKLKFEPVDEMKEDRKIDETRLDESLRSVREEEQRYYIHLSLDRMSPRESLVLRLFYLEERDINEVTEIMGLSKTNIKTILHRSRKRFYSILEKELKHEIKTLL